MKRILMIVLAVIAVSGIGAALLLIGSTPASAGPGYSASDVKGEYLFTVASIGYVGSVLDYCDHAGTMFFDGVGAVTITETRRCSVGGLIAETAVLSYTVNPVTGEVLLEDPRAPGDPTHGQIVMKGRSVLLDGTTRTNPHRLIMHGVAMQR
ncbi:MAG: hypothetical protein AABZ10_06210 [Nitrospirota bacterium]